jgi:hypothetical protein
MADGRAMLTSIRPHQFRGIIGSRKMAFTQGYAAARQNSK